VQQIAEQSAGKALDRVRHERNMLLAHKRYKRSLKLRGSKRECRSTGGR
jgi:hypothetical protein